MNRDDLAFCRAFEISIVPLNRRNKADKFPGNKNANSAFAEIYKFSFLVAIGIRTTDLHGPGDGINKRIFVLPC